MDKNELRMATEKISAVPGAYIASDADVMGDVKIAEEASIWYQSVIRADHDSITIGRGTNIQDGCVLHTDTGYPLQVGEYVTVGHRAILHGCTVGDGCLIGMGAIILNGAKIGKNCIVAAGALVTQRTVIPDGMMVMGSPAKVKRPLTQEEIIHIKENTLEYIECAKQHFSFCMNN